MPTPDTYVFGYGSLIQDASRMRTMPHSEKAIPARALGFRRSWNAQPDYPGPTATFLGVTKSAESRCNGVLIPIAQQDFYELDNREIGYERVVVPIDSIESVGDSSLSISPAAEVFIYLINDPNIPSEDRPIIHSYVDICLSGCLDIDQRMKTGLAFTEEFINTTSDWSSYWVNDRIQPRAPWRHVPNAGKIDGLLERLVRKEFSAIKIE